MGANLQSLFNGILNIFQPAVDVYNQQQQQSLMEQLLSQHPSLMTLNNPQALQQMTSSQTISADANGIGTLFKSGIGNRIRKKNKNSASVEEEKKGGKLKKIRKGLNSLNTSYLFNWESLAQPSYADYLLGAGQNLFQIPNQLIGILNLVGILGVDMSGLSDLIQMNLLQIQNSAEAQKLTQISTLQNKVSKLQDKKNGNPVSNIFGANDLKTAKKTKELADLGEGNVAQAAKGLKNAKMATSGSVMSAASGIANGVMDAFTPDKYYGASSTLKGLQQGYDAVLDAVGMIPGVGTMVLGIGKLVETGLMAANRLSGHTTDSFTVDDAAYENLGGSYSGSLLKAHDAEEKSGTLYGGFAKGAYKKAQEEIAEAKRQQSIVQDVSNTATERFNISDSMAAINNNRRELQMEGGYHQNAVSVGEEGEKLGKNLKRVKKINKKRKKKLQMGGVIGEPDIEKDNVTSYSSYNKPVITRAATQPIEESRIEVVNPELYFPTSNSILIPSEEELTRRLNNEYTNINIPDDDDIEQIIANINADKPRSMEELIQYAEEKNPRFILRMKEFPMILTFTNDYSPTTWAGLGQTEHGSHLLGWEYGPDGLVYVFPMIMEKNEGLGDLFKWDYNDLRLALNEAIKRGDYLNMSEDEADLFTENYKKYYNQFMNVFDEMDEYLNSHPDTSDLDVREMFMNKYNNNIIPEYQEGGSIIPDGALHAHKHHIETDENITEKGIPVVIENKNGEIELVAEIERGEIIFSKEFTEKLENLCKLYYNKEIEQEEKENIALLAGQLLVNEILNNTEDKTGELL